MATRLQRMKELAVGEAKKLKKYATKEEIAKLDSTMLDPDHQNRCIYGQLTGDCYNDRADELIIKCCERVYESKGGGINAKNDKLNGAPTKEETSRMYRYHSPIELVITPEMSGRGAGLKIISYLKGETKTLKL